MPVENGGQFVTFETSYKVDEKKIAIKYIAKETKKQDFEAHQLENVGLFDPEFQCFRKVCSQFHSSIATHYQHFKLINDDDEDDDEDDEPDNIPQVPPGEEEVKTYVLDQ